MGYKINSIWTELRKDDIMELNAIIDDEYCNELEIGRKLNLMKKFKVAFNKALNDFNFDTVLAFMNENNWEWANYDGTSQYAVPTKEKIVEFLETDCFKHGLYNIIELNKKSYWTFSGGIVFEMYWNGGEAYVNIYFDIAHFEKD